MPPKLVRGADREEVDMSQYTRSPVDISLGVAHAVKMNASVKNTETLFPEWNGVHDENWEHPELDQDDMRIFPSHWSVSEMLSLRTLLGYDPDAADIKGKNKKKEPKKKETIASLTQDLSYDAAGNPLPRVYIDNFSIGSTNASSNHIPRDFARKTTGDSQVSIDHLYRDAIMCEAFRSLAACSMFADQCPALHKLIYPQTAEGKPIFNPAGKYIIKLSLAGKWRKVVVNDSVPVSVNRELLLAGSEERMELWPSLLAKAVYKVFYKCGYTKMMNNFTDSNSNQNSSRLSCLFISFTMHILTGWLPTKPMHFEIDTFSATATKMIDSGVPFVAIDCIPSDCEVGVTELDEDRDRSELKTKAALQREFDDRAHHRRCILDAIQRRERLVRDLREALSRPCVQTTFICMASEARATVYRVQAVSFGHLNEAAKVLVKWTASSPTSQSSPIECESFTKLTLAVPFLPPPQSVQQSLWVSLDDLIHGGACCFDLLTVQSMQQEAHLSHHWAPALTDQLQPPSATSAKGKDSKATKENKNVVLEKVKSTDEPYILPPTLLHIDTSGINPNAEFVVLSIFIQADTIDIQSDDVASHSDSISKATLVFQEFPRGKRLPKSFDIDLDTSSELPILSTFIHFPVSLIVNNYILLWVRLLYQSSVYIKLNCDMPVTLGDAESVWKHVDGESLVREGESISTPKFTEQLVFRMQLEAPKDSLSGGDGYHSIFGFLHIPSLDASKYMTLLHADETCRNITPIPRLHGFTFQLDSSNMMKAVLIFSTASIENDTPFLRWKIILLSDVPLACSMLLQNKAPLRFCGSYHPNHRLRLFRDVVSVDKLSSPLAFRFKINNRGDILESIWIKIKIYRKSDMLLILETSGRELVRDYWLPVSSMLVEYAENTEDVSNRDKKDKEKKSPIKKASGPDTTEIIIDCSIDESAMAVPPSSSLRSFKPYLFESLDISNIQSNPSWTLDFIGGSVLKVVHDTKDLERYVSIKKEWDEKSNARVEKANAAMEYFKSRKKIMTEGSDLNPKPDLIPLLIQCLDKSDVKQFEDILLTAQKVYPHVKISTPAVLLRDDRLAEYDENRLLDEDEEQLFKNSIANMQSINEHFKDSVKKRLQYLIEHAEENNKIFAKLWAERTKYKLDVDRKNASLQYMLSRASAAKDALYADPVDSKKGAAKDAKNTPSPTKATVPTNKDTNKKKK